MLVLSDVFFFIISFFLLCLLLSLLFTNNPVHSILNLICIFFLSALLLLTLHLSFLPLLLIIIYVGAIAVLFLFVIMMLNIKVTELKGGLLKYLPIGSILFFIFFLELLSIVYKGFVYLKDPFLFYDWFNLVINYFDFTKMGSIMYSWFFFNFLIVTFILLVAMVGSIIMAFEYNLSNFSRNSLNLNNSNKFSSLSYWKKI